MTPRVFSGAPMKVEDGDGWMWICPYDFAELDHKHIDHKDGTIEEWKQCPECDKLYELI